MSLLLDALKKAAQEKQNADSADKSAVAYAGQGLEHDTDLELEGEAGKLEETQQVEELELVLVEDVHLPAEEYQNEVDQEINQETRQDFQQHRITPTPSTVTDEALQLLIHKTNKQHNKSRVITWGSVVTGAFFLLTISGSYFYFDMMEEIEMMQRKHLIALATLKSKTRIEENLTSLAAVPETDKQVITGDKSSTNITRTADTPTNRMAESGTSRQTNKAFSVQRAEKRDPVSEALERGWQAYQNRDYTLSKREYKKVLDTEPNNHDALLGIAAVSLQQEEMETAREIYIKLLERDPRDPHAHAGLANIAQTSGANLSESKLKQLIEYRPDDAHLQFALGNVYVRNKRWPEAQQAFFNAWKADSSNADYAYNLAVSLDQLGKHSEAKSYYEDSLKLAAGKNISFSPDAVKNRLAYLGARQQP
jgi:tetratricopeptide (TPR) repeat protein